MAGENRQLGVYGSLERWTVGLFAATFFFSVFAWVPAIVCLSYSHCWTRREKLIAVIAPVAASCAVVAYFTYGSPTQDWIRVPLMLTVSGILPSLSALYLYSRARISWLRSDLT